MIKAVIFDLDDTLISERQYVESGYRHIAKIVSMRYKIEENLIYSLLVELLKEDSQKVINRMLDKVMISYADADIAYLVHEYRNHLPTIAFYDDVLPFINFLKKRKIKTGIITDGYAISQRQKINVLNLNKYIDEVIVTDELGRDFWKPHPKAFELLQMKLNVEFKEMLYIGDNPEKDFYISNIYPVTTVRINRLGFYLRKIYKDNIKEHFSISSLNELILYLN